MFAQLRPALATFVLLSVLTGIAYPLAVTGLAQLLFPQRANGSLIGRGGTLIGSELVGQAFDDPRYFWGRPSATSMVGDNATASGGSNLGPTNPALISAIRSRVEELRRQHPDAPVSVPADLVTSSASGLDPHITPAAALYQVGRVARIRGLAPERVRRLVAEQTEGRTLGVLGEPRVNVLRLNLALDALGR